MIYSVKEGKHHFKPNDFGLYLRSNTQRIDATVTFGEGCAYELEYPYNLQINKLFGLANVHHHICSARIGWNYMENNIQLYAYAYHKCKRVLPNRLNSLDIREYLIGSIPIGVPIDISIVADGYFYKYQIHGITVEIKDIQYPHLFGYKMLSPYFGGEVKSPKPMDIDIVYH